MMDNFKRIYPTDPKMTYIGSCGDLCDDEDIYPIVLEYLIDNCPLYRNLRKVESPDFVINREDEIALAWMKKMKI